MRAMTGRLVHFFTTAAAACMGFAWLWILRACAPSAPAPSAGSLPPFDAAFARLAPEEIAALPLATRFDSPIGAENGALTYNARPFRSMRHLGDDLNGIAGWNSDLGDPVYASADGRVVYAGTPSDGWGNLVMLAHRLPVSSSTSESEVIISVYAHLQTVEAEVGAFKRRGEPIGRVGTADGRYLAHLHFEIRQSHALYPGLGYADGPLDRLQPEAFLRAQGDGRPLQQ